MNKIKNYLNQVVIEIKKVSWLSKDELMGSTLVVGLFALIISIFLFVIDYSLSEIVYRAFNIDG